MFGLWKNIEKTENKRDEWRPGNIRDRLQLHLDRRLLSDTIEQMKCVCMYMHG